MENIRSTANYQLHILRVFDPIASFPLSEQKFANFYNNLYKFVQIICQTNAPSDVGTLTVQFSQPQRRSLKLNCNICLHLQRKFYIYGRARYKWVELGFHCCCKYCFGDCDGCWLRSGLQLGTGLVVKLFWLR